MASVMVFVDDAVRGDLPPVCSRDGVPTRDSLGRNQEIGDRAGLGIAWLLLLAGPLGWLGLILIAASRSGRGEALHVRLPMCESAYQRMRGARQPRDRSTFALLIATVATLLLFAMGDTTVLTQFGFLVAGGVAVVSLVTLVMGSLRFERANVGISLDASRRWVTLSNVHPEFAAACEAHNASRAHRT